jgi:hypothetical protein
MFSRHVEHVSATKIFAGDLGDHRQALIYSMKVTVGEPLAMVLPLPVPANGPDDAVEFVSLEGYADVFADLRKAFPVMGMAALGSPKSRGPVQKAPVLKVHAVGAFEASYVPHPRDFARLDPRFQLPHRVLAALPQYADWGFAVFQLAKGKQIEIHPMALRFPRRDPGSIFYPLTHVHDGELPEQASFDHALYGQLPPVIAALGAWTASHDRLGSFVDTNRTRGLVDGARGGHATTMFGSAPNRDLWMRTPPVTLEDLTGRGTSYAYRVNATFHYASTSHHMYPKWLETSRDKLGALCRGMREGIAAVTSENTRAWQLGDYAQGLPAYFMNGNQLWAGTDYRNGRWDQTPSGPGVIAFRPFGELVEQQDIWLAFAQLPAQDDARAINQALCQLLDRIARDA